LRATPERTEIDGRAPMKARTTDLPAPLLSPYTGSQGRPRELRFVGRAGESLDCWQGE
jgi:hypothetical protein